MLEDGDSGAEIFAERAVGNGRPEGERGGRVDSDGLVAEAAGLAKFEKIRKDGDGQTLTTHRLTHLLRLSPQSRRNFSILKTVSFFDAETQCHVWAIKAENSCCKSH